MRRSVSCGLSGSAIFSALSHKRRDFRKKKVIERKMCFDFLAILSEAFLIIRRIQRDMVINVETFSCKDQLFLSDFNETWNSFRQILEEIATYQIS
jgi:hypothetical protein